MLKSDPIQTSIWRVAREEINAADAGARAELLTRQATRTRRSVVSMISAAGQGHIGGDLSVTDILTTLYFGVLRVDPEQPNTTDRDRLILSKGHCAGALYSTLAFVGYFSPVELSTFMRYGSALNGHPNRNKVPGVETNTGPLGHGLPFAVGAARAAKLRQSADRIFVVTGDGELQEGSNWEALMSGAHQHLNNLTLVVDRNRLQQGAGTEETNGLDPLGDKFAAFGWEVREIDGHDFGELFKAFTAPAHRPVAVIANTTKGKGVSFMEDRVEWHHKVPNPEQAELALAELGAS